MPSSGDKRVTPFSDLLRNQDLEKEFAYLRESPRGKARLMRGMFEVFGKLLFKTYCPLNGDFRFTYSINDGAEAEMECAEPVSEATDCPTGYKFDLRFKGCKKFPDHSKKILILNLLEQVFIVSLSFQKR